MATTTANNGLSKSESTDLYSVTRTGLNGNWDIVDGRISKNSWNQSIDPLGTDDEISGYSAGSYWFVADPDNRLFKCVDATENNAVWKLIYDNGNPPTLQADWDAGSHQIRAEQFYADMAQGTAPLVITSTTLVANLNADQLDGNEATAFAVAAKGVTNGDSHDHVSGDGAAIVAGATSFTATNKIIGRKSAGGGVGEEVSLSEMLDLADTSVERGDIIYRNATAWVYLHHGTAGEVLTTGGNGADPAWAAPAGGASFWNDMPGTPTRVGDTSFTITDTGNANLYDLAFKIGTILKWEKAGGGTQLAMITTSSYDSNAVTITIVGSVLAASFTAMQYCLVPAIKDVYIVPGVLPGNTATTDISKTMYADNDLYVIAGLVRYKTASTTTGGTWDINDDATSIFTTKLLIAATATKGTLTGSDCLPAAGGAPVAVAADSLITLDYDAGHATTPGSDAYVTIWYMPVSWRYKE